MEFCIALQSATPTYRRFKNVYCYYSDYAYYLQRWCHLWLWLL